MNEKRGEEAVKIEISQPESKARDQDKNPEDRPVNDKKSLEDMTKAELLTKAKELREEAEKNYDLYLRSQAEIDNMIKRNKREKEEWIKFSNETLIKEILPVVDNLEKAISHSNNENSLDALREGVELTLKGLKASLAKSGVEEVKSVGEVFDPCFHHAVSQRDDDKVEAGIILDELQKGYTLNERLIRPAMVVLSKGKSGNHRNDGNTPDKVCEK